MRDYISRELFLKSWNCFKIKSFDFILLYLIGQRNQRKTVDVSILPFLSCYRVLPPAIFQVILNTSENSSCMELIPDRSDQFWMTPSPLHVKLAEVRLKPIPTSRELEGHESPPSPPPRGACRGRLHTLQVDFSRSPSPLPESRSPLRVYGCTRRFVTVSTKAIRSSVSSRFKTSWQPPRSRSVIPVPAEAMMITGERKRGPCCSPPKPPSETLATEHHGPRRRYFRLLWVTRYRARPLRSDDYNSLIGCKGDAILCGSAGNRIGRLSFPQLRSRLGLLLTGLLEGLRFVTNRSKVRETSGQMWSVSQELYFTVG